MRPDPLSLRLGAGSLPGTLASVRRELAGWARSTGMLQDAVDDLVLATYEALANVADHAYPDDTDGEAWLDVTCPPGEVVVVVRDRGRWRPPATDPGWRGRGLTIMRGLADHFDVQHGTDGTTVQMRWMRP